MSITICSGCKSDGSESKKITFMNRDMNACLNILHISHDWIQSKTRPIKYSRSFNSNLDSIINYRGDHG